MHKELIRKFKAFDIITIAYALATGIILLFASLKLNNVQTHILVRIAVIGLILFIGLVLNDKKSPFARIIRNFYFLPLLFYFISEGDYINNVFFPDLDRYIANFELTLFSEHPGVVLSNIFSFRWFSELMSLVYLVYYLLFIYFFIRVYIKNNEQFEYVAFVVSMIFYMLFIIFMLCPVAGPQYYLIPPENQIPAGFHIRDVARWIFIIFDQPAFTFPSMSAVMMCVISYLTYRNLKPFFKFMLPLAILVCIASIYLKIHFTIDVIAGLLAFPALYWMSSRTYLWIDNFLNGNVTSISGFFYSMYGKH
jgi:membrane-associated phospholipid phosphatase